MIVCRWTYPAKVGKVNELCDLIADFGDRTAPPESTWRLYVSETGQRGNVAVEIEFESYAEYEKRNADAHGRPEFRPFLENLLPLLRSPLVVEFWSRER